jgi:Ala-tRNA(Pro) deacylase
MRLDELLTSRHIPFERLSHRPAYTASRMAQALHIPGKDVAKSVLLRTDQGYVLAVLPATHRVDLEQVRQELGSHQVAMATEEEMGKVFPDCEPGALPPFGSVYNVPTLVDESLTHDEQITFDAQSHQEAMRVAYRDYEAMEHPRLGHFARQA